MLEIQTVIGKKLLPTLLGVEFSEEAVEHALVSNEAPDTG
jgi:hypothetical protein